MDLRPFFSRSARQILALPTARGEPRVLPLECALLFTDISGYTRLTQDAVRAGPASVELFNSALNIYFSCIIDAVEAGGGDVVTFAGDAIVAIFPRGPDGMGQAVRQAAACAQTIAPLRVEGLPDWLAPERSVMSRISLTCGSGWLAAFGQEPRRRHVLAAGAIFESLAACQAAALPGAVTVAASAQAWLDLEIEHPAGPPQRARSDLVLDHAALGPGSPNAGTTITSSHSGHSPSGIATGQFAYDVLDDGDLDEAMLRACLPSAIAERVESHERTWLAEMRPVFPVFMSLPGAERAEPGRAAELIACILALEDQVLRLGGELHAVRCDDKGLVLVGMFGTPGSTHEDDPLRAALAACAARDVARRHDWALRVGVSGGMALCGLYGSAERQDYVVFGDVMNRAARLMQNGKGALCDAATARLAGTALESRPLGTVALKGFQEPVEVVELIGAPSRPRSAEDQRYGVQAANPVIGREGDQHRLETCLKAHRLGELGADERTVLIRGEAGIGKSSLARFALARSRELELPAVVVLGNRIEGLLPYTIWRSALLQLLRIGEDARGEQMQPVVLDLLDRAPDLRAFASLLNEPLHLDIKTSRTTGQMEAAARAAMTVQLLLHLLRHAAPTPTVIVVEDAHWIDSASWSVIAQAAQAVPCLMMLMTLRPPDDAQVLPARLLVERSSRIVLDLKALSESELGAIVATRLQAAGTTPEMARLIAQRSGGNPFFAQELALALRERGDLVVEGGLCAGGGDLGQVGRMALPSTVRAAVLERVDRLSARQQLVLKVASVVGTTVQLEALGEIFADVADPGSLEPDLLAIESRQLANVVRNSDETILCFRHAITQEAAYAMLTPSQKTALHGSVARWFEARHSDGREPFLPLLAYHFRAADDRPKALFYLAAAGEQALEAHANSEAVQFFTGALALEERSPVPMIEQVKRRRMLAEAHLKLSNLAACRAQLLDALALNGRDAPRSTLAQMAALCTALLGELAFYVGARPRVRETSASLDALMRAQLQQLRAEVAYFEHDTLALLHGTFMALRAARLLGPTRELANAHATAAIVTGLMGLHRLARHHLSTAEDHAAEVGHVPTAAYVQHLACVCFSAMGDWPSATRAIDRAAEGYRQSGDLYRWQSTRMMLAYQALHQGRIDEIGDYLVQADAKAVFPSGPLQVRIWFRTIELAQANARSVGGKSDPAAMTLIEEVKRLAELGDPSQVLLCRGFLADALRLAGDLEASAHQAELGLELLRRYRPSTYYSLFGIVSIAGTFLSIAEREPAAWRDMRPRVGSGLLGFRRFARMIPIARPSMFLLQARASALDGRSERARRCLAASAEGASRLGMRGVEAAAKRQLALVRDLQFEASESLPWV